METQGREKDHSLALKVMRLTKPSLMVGQPVTVSCPRSIVQNSLNECHSRELSTITGLEHFALSNLLTLPQNFGNIFLGETFSSYISVHNDSQHVCKDILVKADLQTSSQRLTLSSQQEATKELQPQESIDEVIHHEVKELGTHILVCAVSYTSNTGEKMYFRKFFKFQVLKPLDVKTKFYNAESDEVYLEAQIQNITPGPIFMDRVELDPSQYYHAVPLNAQDNKENSEKGVFGRVSYMSPLDVRQYLYCLTPRAEMAADPKLMKAVTNIGKLDIVWKTNLGEKGRLQTSPLQRVAPGFGDIRLTVESLPDTVLLEKTFPVKVKITNCCERTMDLVLVMENNTSAGLLWCGISGREIGKLPPNSAKLVELEVIGVTAGLQTLSGLRLTDTFLKRTYEHDEIAQVFVYCHEH